MPLVWIVDPIDGTRAFIAGRADWTISVALVEDGRPIVAALYAPVTDEMFLRGAGAGATLNGAPIAASDGAALDRRQLAGPEALSRPAARHSTRASWRSPRSIRWRCGSRASPTASSTPPSPRRGSHDWDLAAADLLVHEAGGALTTFAGRPLSLQSPARRAWRADRRRTRPPWRRCIDLVRDRRSEFA